ncbi:MAG: HlyD family efflux transporter periplasmic adaptor subunit [Planctomycetota bacterium]
MPRNRLQPWMIERLRTATILIRKPATPLWLVFAGSFLLSPIGCGKSDQGIPEKRPRPVSTGVLLERFPPDASLVTASVDSWKTEEIGFEVGGRVEFVVEPRTEVRGRIQDETGNMIAEGTPMGRLESERYELQVAKGESEVVRAEKSLLAAETELNESMPAQMSAAKATRELARADYERIIKLASSNATSQSEVDSMKANYDIANSEIKQLEAAISAKEAEVQSLFNGVLQAKQNLRDAERNLEDCTLYASFDGQISSIAVVPGSVVQQGQAVVTLQMMDPIKVELEVSAEDSRRLQNQSSLPVSVTLPDGTQQILEGHLYIVDPVADPLMRTFTITLLVMNEKLANPNDNPDVATTRDIWPLNFKFLPGADKDKLFVEEGSLQSDDQGDFLWLVTNATIASRQKLDLELKVRKMRVRQGEDRIPFLGNWIFREVEVLDPDFDPEINIVTGKLIVEDGDPSAWNGNAVMLDPGGQWKLRPGDLVKVDLSGSGNQKGYFVPMDAIVRTGSESAIFVVDDSGGQPVVRKRPIRLVDDRDQTTSSLRQIEAIGESSLDGQRYVVEGAHYLIDGEPIKVVTVGQGADQ